MQNEVDGLYVITPFRRVDLVSSIVRALRDDEHRRISNALVKAS
jgi:hypothetical protein